MHVAKVAVRLSFLATCLKNFLKDRYQSVTEKQTRGAQNIIGGTEDELLRNSANAKTWRRRGGGDKRDITLHCPGGGD